MGLFGKIHCLVFALLSQCVATSVFVFHCMMLTDSIQIRQELYMPIKIQCNLTAVKLSWASSCMRWLNIEQTKVLRTVSVLINRDDKNGDSA